PEGGRMKAGRRHQADTGDDAVAPDIVLRHGDRHRIYIGGENGDITDLPKSDSQYAATGAEIERPADRPGPRHRVDNLQTTGCRTVVAGAEGLPGVNLDGDVVFPD